MEESYVENEEEVYKFLLAGRPHVPLQKSSLSKKQQLIQDLQHKINEKKILLESIDIEKLADKGSRIKQTIADLEGKLRILIDGTSESQVGEIKSEITMGDIAENENNKPNFEIKEEIKPDKIIQENDNNVNENSVEIADNNNNKNESIKEEIETNEDSIIDEEEEDILKEIEEQLKILSIHDGLEKKDPITPEELKRKEDRKEYSRYGRRGLEIQQSKTKMKLLPLEEGIAASKVIIVDLYIIINYYNTH